MTLPTSLDSLRYTRLDQCGGGTQRHANRSWKPVGDPGDLGSGAVFVDDQADELDTAKPKGRYVPAH
jgi:hypothetical protein